MIEGDEQMVYYDKKNTIKILGEGSLFGEVGLLNQDSVRSAACISVGRSVLGVVPRKFWNLIQSDRQDTTLFSQDIISLEMTRGFKGISKKRLIELYDTSKKEKVTSQTILFEEGEFVSDYIYVILAGVAMIVKEVDMGEGKPSQTLEIDRIDKGEVLGDYCFVFKESLPYTVVSIYPMRLLKIPVKEIKESFTDDQLLTMVNAVKIYPRGEHILQIYKEKVKWKGYANDVTQDIQNRRLIHRFKTSADSMAKHRIPPIYRPKVPLDILDEMCIRPSLEEAKQHLKRGRKKGSNKKGSRRTESWSFFI